MAPPSPLRPVERMPEIPYYVVHTDMDDMIPVQKHSDLPLRRMRERGLETEYVVVPDRGHCDLPEKDWNDMVRWVIRQVEIYENKKMK